MAWRRLLVIAMVGCGRVAFEPTADGSRADVQAFDDSGLGAWSAPVPVPGADTAVDEQDCTLSSTTLELYFNRYDATNMQLDIDVMTRTSPSSAWTAPVPASFDALFDDDANPRLTPDDLSLYFGTSRSGSAGYQDVAVTTRSVVGGMWSTPQPVPNVNTVDFDKWMSVCNDGHYVMVRTLLSIGLGERLFQGMLGGPPPTQIAELDVAPFDAASSAFLTPDCLTLYYAMSPDGQVDIYTSHRATVTSTWESPQRLSDFNQPGSLDEDPWISPDGRTFCFASDRRNPGGDRDLYISTR